MSHTTRRKKDAKAQLRTIRSGLDKITDRERLEIQQNKENVATGDRLRDLEDIITRGLMTFQEVGYALLEIRDQKLWKPFYASFDDYCLERWKFGARHGNNMIRAAKVAEVVPVKNEAIAREFAQLAKDDPEKAREVFDALNGINPGHTALEARAFIRDPKPALPPRPQDDFMRRTKSYIEGMLAKFEDDHPRRQKFIWDLCAYTRDQLHLSMYNEYKNDPSQQAETAEIMVNSDDPALIEKGKRKKAKLLADATK